MLRLIILIICTLVFLDVYSQSGIKWNTDGNSYTTTENGSIVEFSLPALQKKILLDASKLTPEGSASALRFFNYEYSDVHKKILLFTDARREYHNTFSNCWVYDLTTGKLIPTARIFKSSSLLNAKLSPDGTKLAFVYNNNIYAEDISTHKTIQLTGDGNERRLNGWFDYVYSEELFCEDGIRWSPDSRQIAYYQLDLSKEKTFYLINNTDSNYSKPVPLIFAKPGEPIAAARIGIVSLETKKTKWMNLPGDPGSH